MKKLLILFIALTLALSLAACGENGSSDDPLKPRDENTSQTQPSGAQGIKDGTGLSLEAILMYVETGDTEYFRPRVLTSSEQAALRADVEKQGGSVTFDVDGTINITGSDSSRITVRSDGSVEGVDADGQPFGFSNKKDWPSSALGSAVPKAEFGIKMHVEDDESLMIMFKDVSFDQAKAYGQQLASAGFTVDPSELEMKENGMYSYSGTNADGITAEFSYMASGGEITCALTVGKHTDDPGVDVTPGGAAGTPSDLPAHFAFMLPDGKGDFDVYNNDYFYSVEKAGGTLPEAKTFASRCASNGYEERMVQENKNDDGSDVYFAVYTKDKYEIHISLNMLEKKLQIDLIETQSGTNIPAGTDSWPTSGPLTRIPKPDFGTGFTIRDDGDSITVSVTGATAANFAPYMQSLQNAGFTVSPEYDDDDDVKLYEAHNKEGYDAYVQWAYGVFAVGVTTIPE